MMWSRGALGVSALLLCAQVLPSAADPVVIDFDDFDLGGAVFLDLPETMIYPDAGGSGIEVTIEGHDDIRIYDLALYGGDPGGNGQALIDMSWSSFNNTLGTDIHFSGPVANFSLQAADYGSDDDSPLTLTAFDALGTVVGFASATWNETAYPPFVTLAIEATGIRRIHWHSGGIHQNSMFIDNLSFEPALTATAAISWSSLKGLYR